MKHFRLIAKAIILALLLVGSQLIAPRPAMIPSAPSDLPAESVSIPTTKDDFVRGWWIQGTSDKRSVLLLHGIRSNRLSMLGRARLLWAHGYSVLLLDLQGHGESPGEAITFGWRESVGVAAARNWMKHRQPGAKVGVIGVSLGGASVLLGEVPCGFDAVVLEAVYTNIHRAINNRLSMRLGMLGPLFTPLLEWQLQPRLGLEPEALNPAGHISRIGSPVFIVAGGRDQHTHLDESQAMYASAKEPKALWVLPDAIHEDFYARNPKEYALQVVGFLNRYLASSPREGSWSLE